MPVEPAGKRKIGRNLAPWITGHPVGDTPTVASTADFKNGLVLAIDGQLWQIVEFQHVKPGKGPAFVRTKLKNAARSSTRRTTPA